MGKRSSKTRGWTWKEAWEAISSASVARNVRSAKGPIHIVISIVANMPAPARTTTGSKTRRRLMPRAVRAISSLSEDIRPSPSKTPIRTAMGIVKANTPGKVERSSFRTWPPDPEWRTNNSISRTSCGTKNTNVKTTRPRSAWRETSRTM